MLKVALGQAPHCEIYGTDYPTPDGTCIRDYIHIVDLAQAHILGLQPGKQRLLTTSATATVIPSATGHPDLREGLRQRRFKAIEKPRRPGDPPRLVAAAQKAVRELGWKPKFPKLEDIVATAWAWHKQHPTGYPD